MASAGFFAYHPPAPTARRGPNLRALSVGAAAAIFLLPSQPGNPATFDPGLQAAKPFTAELQPQRVSADAAGLAIAPALPFAAQYGDAASAARAETCLAEAIYYEGALESISGQRAIAQVVLNRVRHPAFPNSVCGVVFQGQELPTGCQFTFTCDGSRARPPVLSLWRQARLVAKAALGGAVAQEVGLATHYHADYVAPYWRSSLDPAGQIGAHLFYRWRGNAGTPRAFSASYAGREPVIAAWNPAANPQSAAADSLAGVTGDAGDMHALDGNVLAASESAALPPTPFKARPLRLASGAGPAQ